MNNSSFFYNRYLISSGFSLIFSLFFFYLLYHYQSSGYWMSWSNYNLNPTLVCEYLYNEGLFKQPNSTFSNVFFLFFGLMILLWKPNTNSPQNLITQNPSLATFMGLLVLGLFLGSSFYHSSVLKIAAYCDMFGVYSVAFYVLYFQLSKFYIAKKSKQDLTLTNPEKSAFISLVLGSTLLFDFLFKDDALPVIIVFSAILLSFLAASYNTNFKFNKRYLLGSILFSFFGIFSFFTDHHVCYQYSLLQGHSVWHICCAACIYTVFLIFSTEELEV